MRFIVAAAVQRVPREFNTKEFVSRAYIILKCTYEDTCKSTPVILQELIGVHPLTKRQFVYDLCSGSTLCRKEIMPLKSFMNWNSHACASEWQKVGTFFFYSHALYSAQICLSLLCARISVARGSEISIRLCRTCFLSIDKLRRGERIVPRIRWTTIWQNASCSGRVIIPWAYHLATACFFFLFVS